MKPLQWELDESAERALFARRARAMGAPEIAPLEEVLALADEAERPAVRGYGRTTAVVVGALAVAAAVGALFFAAPREASRAIVADSDAGVVAAPAIDTYTYGNAAACEPGPEPMATFAAGAPATCTADERYALAPADDRGACFQNASVDFGLSCERESLCTAADPGL